MKRIFLLFTVFISVVSGLSSCGPTTYALGVEIRKPSASGMDLVGKNLSVVFLDNGDSGDSLFISALSGSFADKLDAEYFSGDSLVTLYSLNKKEGVEYDSRDSMINLLVETGSDVVFLFDTPEFEAPVLSGRRSGEDIQKDVSGILSYKITLFAYDGMDREDSVKAFYGSNTVPVSAYLEGSETREEQLSLLKASLVSEAENMGRISGNKFTVGWAHENMYFYMYDAQKWYESYYAVADYDWQTAMNIWMSLLDTKNLQKKACLEYNLATACYIQGQYSLAREWIELSAKDCKLPLTDWLTSIISSRL